MENIYKKLANKKQKVDKYQPINSDVSRNLEEWFAIELTYTSNAIEGNTLTRRETAVVIEKGIAVGGKSLREHLEATNHVAALEAVRAMTRRVQPASVADVLTIHRHILKSIDDAHAGSYRDVPVRIAGSAVVLPNARKVPELMEAFDIWLQAGPRDVHPVAFSAEAHYRLVTIHPFIDGNGRTARLLMNLILLQHGYPPAIIRKRDRLAYIGALEKAQLGGPKLPYETLIAKAADRSLDIYLAAVRGENFGTEQDSQALLRIGALAKAVGVMVPTIRHWTHEGLLEVAELTPSGYQLYAPEMVARCRQIRVLQKQRLLLAEIRARLEG